MRTIMTGPIVLLTLFAHVASAHAIEPKSNRTAQTIAFVGAREIAETADPEQSDRRIQLVPAMTQDFVLVDLSRHWHTSQMAARVRATTQVPRASPLRATLNIPSWMLAETSSPIIDIGDCIGSKYRPSGFLRFEAERRRLAHYSMMSSIACEYGLPVALFDAMIMRESEYRTDAYSSKSAFGLTQLMPGTAAALRVNRYRVEDNLRGGARYLRQQLDRFGQYHLALAAYNAGPGRIRHGRVPPIAETRDYVEDILFNWSRLSRNRVDMASAEKNSPSARQVRLQSF